MNILTAKQKNDVRHCDTAMPALGIFERKRFSKREEIRLGKDDETLSVSKSKYALHNQPLICFNERVDQLKKTP
ncbi:MAG TPA: hypothetical protein VJ904_07200 [Tichowtungia sp.]|nr:hypothetical protein [Tichowtungia sp.]